MLFMLSMTFVPFFTLIGLGLNSHCLAVKSMVFVVISSLGVSSSPLKFLKESVVVSDPGESNLVLSSLFSFSRQSRSLCHPSAKQEFLKTRHSFVLMFLAGVST